MSKVTENRHIIYDGVINKNLKYYLLYMIIVFVDVFYKILFIRRKTFAPKKYHISICGCFKNEARFFKEWIEYLEENKISWIVWQFSDRVESSSLIRPKEQVMLDMYNSGKYTSDEILNKKYKVEDLLSETGKYTKKIIRKYTLNKDEEKGSN